MRIRDIMSSPAVVCGRNETLNGAARLMWERDCGALPVVGDDGRIVGIVTDRDLCMAAYTQGKPLNDIPLGTAMSAKVISCRADDLLESTIRLMADNQVRRLPVVDADDRPIGVVSFSDLVRHASTVAHGEDVDYDVLRGYAALSRPPNQAAAPAPPPKQPREMPAAAAPGARRARRATVRFRELRP